MCALQPVARGRGHLSLSDIHSCCIAAHSKVFHMDGKQARRRGIPVRPETVLRKSSSWATPSVCLNEQASEHAMLNPAHEGD
jgi:hypothetical protein